MRGSRDLAAAVRADMESARRAAFADGARVGDPALALEKLGSDYLEYGAAERAVADVVIAEWALSEDAAVRLMARQLIRRFEITSAIPALQSLIQRLADARDAAAAENRITVGLIEEIVGDSERHKGDPRQQFAAEGERRELGFDEFRREMEDFRRDVMAEAAADWDLITGSGSWRRST